MNLGVSSLGLDVNDSRIFSILKDNNIEYIELVLPKFFNWDNAELDLVLKFIDNASKYELKILSTQSILYNTNIKSLHHTTFTEHLINVSNICKQLNIDKLVLGAPKTRVGQVDHNLFEIFNNIDIFLRSNNQILLLEPNSKIYSGEYFFTVDSITKFIQTGNFTNIRTMIDTHNCILENGIPSVEFEKYFNLINHIHVSEIELKSFQSSLNHTQFAETIKNSNYQNLIIYESIEFDNLHDSLNLFAKTYNI